MFNVLQKYLICELIKKTGYMHAMEYYSAIKETIYSNMDATRDYHTK